MTFNQLKATIATTLASLVLTAIPATSQAQWQPDSGRQTWFTMPTTTQLRASSHRVFADYMPCFPLQIDNVPADVDYYSRVYLNPEGYEGRWTNCGGFLRERPLPPLVDNAGNANYQADNYRTEFRRAANAGIDGFNFFYGDFSEATLQQFDTMLSLAAESGFKLRFHPDMYDIDPTDAPNVYNALVRVKDAPALDRLADGRIVVSPYLPNKNGLAFWQDVIRRWKAAGLKIAFVPVLQDFQAQMPTWGPVCDGVINWGADRSSYAAANKAKYPNLKIYGNSVTPQIFRPKTMDFKESLGSHRYRVWWGKLIACPTVDWVDVSMWNDYAENTQVAPSSKTGTAFYEVTSYYLTWFKTGVQPTILKDRLFAFQRIERYIPIDPILAAQRAALAVLNGDPIVDEVELVGFLKTPGTMDIVKGTKTTSMDAPAGISELRAPLVNGTFAYGLRRGATQVAYMTSPYQVTNGGIYPNMLYHGIAFSVVNP